MSARFDSQQQRVAVESVGIDEITLEMSSHDAVAQRTDSQYVLLRQGDVRLFPVRIRYAYVSELDLMARLAGLRLRERWANWRREPFPSAESSRTSRCGSSRANPEPPAGDRAWRADPGCLRHRDRSEGS